MAKISVIKKIIATFVVVIIVAGFVALYSLAQLLLPAGSAKTVSFTIEAGEGVHAISRNLKSAGLIRSSFMFETYICWPVSAQSSSKCYPSD